MVPRASVSNDSSNLKNNKRKKRTPDGQGKKRTKLGVHDYSADMHPTLLHPIKSVSIDKEISARIAINSENDNEYIASAPYFIPF